MKQWFIRLLCLGIGLFVFAPPAPAPLIYTPGEGWRYEPVGSEGKWVRGRAKEQMEVAQAAFEKKNYSLALRAANRTVKQWPFSDYAPQAQYLIARCYEAKGKDEKAFKAYQLLLERYPKLDNFNEIVDRQYVIANRYLAGKWFRLWGYIPALPSMDNTIKMYEQIIKNGPYSDIAPAAQMNIGAANEKKLGKDYPAAARAYERAADRYSDRPVSAEALYKAGMSYNKQAKKAEYDQSVAGQAISTFSDFSTLHPQDARVPETQKTIASLKTEQARGSYETARFYEKHRRWQGALIYYNEVLIKDPTSKYAESARQRIDSIKKKTKE
jgi:outer membrane protein assembly factor BamD